MGDNNGKWLVFVPQEFIDVTWDTIKTATENGLLGPASKVSTRRVKPGYTENDEHVICVYTYNGDVAEKMSDTECFGGFGYNMEYTL
jgi:hypothetical protein